MRKLLILLCALMLVGCGSTKEDDVVITPTDNPVNTEPSGTEPTPSEPTTDGEVATSFRQFILDNECPEKAGIAKTPEGYTFVYMPKLELPEGYVPERTSVDAKAETRDITMSQAEELIRVLTYYAQHSELMENGSAYKIDTNTLADMRRIMWGTNNDAFLTNNTVIGISNFKYCTYFRIVDENGEPILRLEIDDPIGSFSWAITEYVEEVKDIYEIQREEAASSEVYDGETDWDTWYIDNFMPEYWEATGTEHP